MALIRATAEATDNDEYNARVGINWTGGQPLTILTKDKHGFTYDGVSIPLHRYTPVETTVNALAHDRVNQGGISNVLMIQPLARDDQRRC
jgi:hypothetical protein